MVKNTNGNEVLEKIISLRRDGYTYKEISEKTCVPVGTIKTYFHRHKDIDVSCEIIDDENFDDTKCKNCGKELEDNNRHKKFCSNKCKDEYWNKNRERLNKKFRFICPTCKKEFSASRKRIYCSKTCSNKGRVKNG